MAPHFSPAPAPLFRQEAIEARRASLIGEALQANPISFPRLTACAIGVVIVLLLVGFFGQVTRKARVQGYLAPSAGLIKVFAAEAGTVIERRVTEGQAVKRGDALLVISTERASAQTAQAQADAIAQLEQQIARLGAERGNQDELAHVQAGQLRESILGQERELEELDRSLAIQQERVRNAETVSSRHQDLLARHFVSQILADEKRAEMLDQQSRLQDMRRARVQLLRQIETQRRELAVTGLNARQRSSELERQKLSLSQQRTEYESRRTLVVTAPADGTVTSILAEPGQAANTRAPLMVLLPVESSLQAKLLVPSQSIGFIAVGDTVRLRYHAFPYQRFGSFEGHVTEVARSLMAPADLDLPMEIRQPVYRVTVSLAGQQIETPGTTLPLQAGMQLDADVWLERRRLVEWLVEPLLTVTKRI